MAVLTITIPDNKVSRVLDAFAGQYGWTADAALTKAQFVRAKIREHIRETVKAWESSQASSAAGRAAGTTADTDTETITVT